ncbi:ErfK/YbiS/YcfS/YnhG family protein [Chitinispirillum alkaliphilum]|nr:ErfK/YbiS/YcfS/YnhG family protein [Chitinispirillum alkaliphilum]
MSIHHRKNHLKEVFSSLFPSLPNRYIDIDIEKQVLYYVSFDSEPLTFPVSTSKFGIGSEENSFKTPLGVHFICEKIGADYPSGTVFKSRKATGQIWRNDFDQENMILSRILRLKGLEPGKNAGAGIDSYQRFIYIHGTNREKQIGTPNSHGCVCMRNNDIIELFNLVEEGTIVNIS